MLVVLIVVAVFALLIPRALAASAQPGPTASIAAYAARTYDADAWEKPASAALAEGASR